MTRRGRQTLLLWVAAVMAGGLLAAVLELALVPILDDQVRLHATSDSALNWGFVAVQAVMALVSAIAIAGPPAFVLSRRLVGIAAPWIVASAVAALLVAGIPFNTWLAGGPGYLIAADAQPSLVLFPLVVGAVSGCATGVAQAIVLKPYVRGAAWWIPAVIGGRAVANVATALVNWQVGGAGIRVATSTDFYVEAIVGVLVGWLIVGLVTGVVLVRLLGELDPERTAAAT
jgi:hypothetical protein